MTGFFHISRQDLYNEIWKTTISHFVKEKGISYDKLRIVCEKYDIPMPTVDYWRELKKGNNPKIPELPLAENVIIEIPFKNRRKFFGLTSKANTVCILKIIEKYADEKRPISVGRIIEIMDREYELSVSRATVYNSVEILNKLGYDISTFSDNKQGYYLKSREFESYEIQMIIDSVSMNPFVPEKMEKSIQHKMWKKTATINNLNYCRSVEGINKRNKLYHRFYYTLEQFELAKITGKKMTFEYGEISPSGGVISGTSMKFTLTPYRTIFKNNSYYIQFTDGKKKEYILFNVNKIFNAVVADDDAEKHPDYDKSKHYMIDKPGILWQKTFVKLKCSAGILVDAMDFFGDDLNIEDNGDKTVLISARLDYEKTRNWCLMHISDCEVLEPENLRNEIIDEIKKNSYGI